MLTIELELNDDEHTRVVGAMSGLFMLDHHFNSRLYRYQINKNVSSRHWSVKLFIDFIDRSKSEIDLVFGEDHEIKFLSELFKAPIKLIEKVSPKFTSKSVVPDITYVLSVDDSLKDIILSSDIQIDLNENDFPYLPLDKQNTLKPWDSWLTWLQRLSIETQRQVFLSMLNDLTADDCIEMMKWETDTDQVNYFINNATRSDNREFVEYMVKRTTEINSKQLIENIKANVARINALHQIINQK